MRRLFPIGLSAFWLAGCGGIGPSSTFIYPDLSGTWPVSFADLKTAEGTACTLTGLTLVMRQQQGREVGSRWQAMLEGTYGPAVLICGSAAPVTQPAGTFSGSLDGPNVSLSLSSGSRLNADRLIGPAYNVITLRGPALWVADAGPPLTGQWTGGPIETPTAPPR